LRLFARTAEIFTPELMRRQAGQGDPSPNTTVIGGRWFCRAGPSGARKLKRKTKFPHPINLKGRPPGG
jgi:hypothetical protein